MTISLQELEAFWDRFNFTPEGDECLGLEAEYFLTKKRRGTPIPRVDELLKKFEGDDRWTYEFPRSQIECRTNPHRTVDALIDELAMLIELGQQKAGEMGLMLDDCPAYMLDDVPLDHYPSDRYNRIAKEIDPAIKDCCMRVAGIHGHFGFGEKSRSIRGHNNLVKHLPELLAMGNLSNGRRIKLFQRLSPNLQPWHYDSPEDVFRHAKEQGWYDDFGRCWAWIRLTVHGTVEVRVFDTTFDLGLIRSWVERAREIAFA